MVPEKKRLFLTILLKNKIIIYIGTIIALIYETLF